MAEHILETRILLRYGTFIEWSNSDIILKKGEAAVVAFPRSSTLFNTGEIPQNTPPAIGLKIGDGEHYFYELPWVQAVAADVYSWAKASTPPNANSIPGLNEYISNYISENGGGGSSGGNASTQYRITYDNATSKYILQYYDENEEDWVNTTSEISLSDIYNRINTIERWANGARTNLGNIEVSITEYVYEEVVNYLNYLDYNDTSVAHQFVTSVTQDNGQIAVTRAAISANDISSGILSTEYGGTGLNYVEEDEILVGSVNGRIIKKKFVTEIDENRAAFATVGAIKDYVAQQTAGLTGAMHFVGDATVTIANNSHTDPQITGYDFRDARPGDVVLANNAQEYVWTGDYWRLLGDEGSYAIKGSIKDADIDQDANIAQSKINNLVSDLDNKVDKEEGKGLSTNDYTTEEKNKLASLTANGQENVIEHIILNENEVLPTTVNGVPKTVELVVKEFDDTAREKLANIEAGAQVNTIDSISLNGTVQYPDNNKQVNLVVSEMTPEEKAKLASIEAGAQVNTIQSIYLNDHLLEPALNTRRVDINIVEITQEQINKLNGIEEGAQVNVIEGIVYDNVALSPDSNGIVNIESDPHTEHENVIEHIKINNIEQEVDNNKTVNIILDQAALDLDVVAGAEIPKANGNGKDEVDQINKKLQFERIAVTGDVKDLLQTNNTYIIFDCGSSTEVI